MDSIGKLLIEFVNFLEDEGFTDDVTNMHSKAIEFASIKEENLRLKISGKSGKPESINDIMFYAITEGLPHEHDSLSASIKNVILNKLNNRIHEDCEYRNEFLTDILDEL